MAVAPDIACDNRPSTSHGPQRSRRLPALPAQARLFRIKECSNHFQKFSRTPVPALLSSPQSSPAITRTPAPPSHARRGTHLPFAAWTNVIIRVESQTVRPGFMSSGAIGRGGVPHPPADGATPHHPVSESGGGVPLPTPPMPGGVPTPPLLHGQT
jgi:hypothetical protein